MRNLTVSLFLILTACGSSADNSASGDEPSGPQGTGGAIDVSGTGGSAVVGGTSGAPGAAGSAIASGAGSSGAGSGGAGSSGGSSTAGVSVVVTPAAGHAAPAGTVKFSAAVSGTTNSAVNWTVQEGTAGGSISSSGVYTAPATAGTYHVVATSQADPKASGKGTVLVNAVGSCLNLPASGTWENISPDVVSANDATFSKGFSEALIVDPFDPATVWLTVGINGLLKSTNCGASWTHVNTGRNGDVFDRGSKVSMAVDPVDRGTLYAISIFNGAGFWKSTNGGVDWDDMFGADGEVHAVTNNFADAISMDPGNHLHMVVSFHTGCSGAYAPTCEAETKDGGKTWRLFKTPNPGWEEGAGAWVVGPTTWLYGGGDLFLTQDSGSTWTKVTPKGLGSFSGGEVATHSIPRTADGTYYLTSNGGLATSSDGLTWTAVPDFPNRVVGFTMSEDTLYASDQWTPSYYKADLKAKKWSKIPPAAGLPDNQGAPYLNYDPVHHILYSSNFAGGTWRLVTP